jgi:hypothetical protein
VGARSSTSTLAPRSLAADMPDTGAEGDDVSIPETAH